MKKISLLLFFALFLGVSHNAVMGLSTPDYPYYECPSMEKYSPLMNVSLYCMRSTPMKPSEFRKCANEYKELYTKPKAEYRKRQCKLSKVRYTQISYGVGACKVEYVTEPEPMILSSNPTNNQGNKCIQKLKAALRKAYPDIKEQEPQE